MISFFFQINLLGDNLGLSRKIPPFELVEELYQCGRLVLRLSAKPLKFRCFHMQILYMHSCRWWSPMWKPHPVKVNIPLRGFPSSAERRYPIEDHWLRTERIPNAERRKQGMKNSKRQSRVHSEFTMRSFADSLRFQISSRTLKRADPQLNFRPSSNFSSISFRANYSRPTEWNESSDHRVSPKCHSR